MSYPAAGHITCREWVALGLIVLSFVLLVGLLIGGIVLVSRVLKS